MIKSASILVNEKKGYNETFNFEMENPYFDILPDFALLLNKGDCICFDTEKPADWFKGSLEQWQELHEGSFVVYNKTFYVNNVHFEIVHENDYALMKKKSLSYD